MTVFPYRTAAARGSAAGPPRSARGRGQLRPPLLRPWLRLLLWRWRFVLAAALLGVATAQIVAEVRPPPAATLAVVVAGKDLDAGVSLAAADLRVVRVPTDLVPQGTHPGAGAVVGRSLVARVPEGLPIVDALLAGDQIAAAGPPGTVVAPVRLADPAVAALIRPGDRIDLLAALSTADGAPVARTLAQRALVVGGPELLPAADSTDELPGGFLDGSAPAEGALTLVAVSPEEAAALAGSVGWASISAVLVK